MKIRMATLLAVILITLQPGCGGDRDPGGVSGTITISGAWALYPLTIRWAEEFKKIHPGIRFDISAGGAGKGMADSLGGVVDLGMVSREVKPAEIEQGAWWVAVAKDAVVAVMNRENPAAAIVRERGMTREEFAAVWLRGENTGWPPSPKGGRVPEKTVYTRSDACGAAEVWARYLGGEQEDLNGVGVYGDPGLAQAVRRDFGGIGFNNINYAYDLKSGAPVGGLMVIPIDRDGNGQIGPEEDFYGSLGQVADAIADGRYPSPPARDLHLTARGRPESEAVLTFLRWVLAEGQELVEEAGYVRLSPEKILGERAKLGRAAPGPGISPDGGEAR
jgi:phosphate transport system substrate-binding protein